MKKTGIAGFLLSVCLLLAGCTSQNVDTTPVWQQALPQTGVQMEVSNCTLENSGPVYYAMDRVDTDYWTEKTAVQVEGVPVVTLYGVDPEEVELRFVENVSYLYIYYDKVMPQPDLDYVLTETDDGALQYRLDTVYNYEFVITTEQGTDSMMVICHRDGLESANTGTT